MPLANNCLYFANFILSILLGIFHFAFRFLSSVFVCGRKCGQSFKKQIPDIRYNITPFVNTLIHISNRQGLKKIIIFLISSKAQLTFSYFKCRKGTCVCVCVCVYTRIRILSASALIPENMIHYIYSIHIYHIFWYLSQAT